MYLAITLFLSFLHWDLFNFELEREDPTLAKNSIHLIITLYKSLNKRVGSSQDCIKPPSFCSIAKYHQFYTIFYTVINCQNYIFFRNRFMYIVICVSLAEDPTRYFSNRYSIIFIYIHFSAKVGSSRDIST